MMRENETRWDGFAFVGFSFVMMDSFVLFSPRCPNQKKEKWCREAFFKISITASGSAITSVGNFRQSDRFAGILQE
jgi:hypothetical protein